MFINVCSIANVMNENNYIKKQLDRVNALKATDNQDQYNTSDPLDITQYKRMLHQNTAKYALQKGETLSQFTTRVQLHIDIGYEKNERIHISAPKGAWYQHRNPAGCFCCEDQNMIAYLINILHILAHQYPKIHI